MKNYKVNEKSNANLSYRFFVIIMFDHVQNMRELEKNFFELIRYQSKNRQQSMNHLFPCKSMQFRVDKK